MNRKVWEVEKVGEVGKVGEVEKVWESRNRERYAGGSGNHVSTGMDPTSSESSPSM
jgi:hypothetical protein